MVKSLVIEGLRTWWSHRQQKREAATQVELEEIRAGIRGGDRLIKSASFVVFHAPLVWAIFDPAGVAEYFNTTLAALPDWYIQVVIGITGSIWGLAMLKGQVAGTIARAIATWKRLRK